MAGAARARRTQRKCISGGVVRRNARRAAGVLKRPRCFHLTTQSRSRVRCTLVHWSHTWTPRARRTATWHPKETFFSLREMDFTAKMEISVNHQQFMPPACFFASQSIQLSPTDSQCSNKSASKQAKRQRSSSPELLRCKRRLNFAGFGYSLPPQQPHAVARRNERERNRVKLVNNGFATLREHVPNGAANKKMSKVETLRSAVEYIRALQQLLDEHDAVSAAFQSGVLSPTISQNYSNDMNSMAGSPVSSYSSDEGSYDPLSPEEQELLDFTNWFWTFTKGKVRINLNNLYRRYNCVFTILLFMQDTNRVLFSF